MRFLLSMNQSESIHHITKETPDYRQQLTFPSSSKTHTINNHIDELSSTNLESNTTHTDINPTIIPALIICKSHNTEQTSRSPSHSPHTSYLVNALILLLRKYIIS